MKRSRYFELQKNAAKLAQKALPGFEIRPEHVEIAWFGIENSNYLLGLVNVFNEKTFCGKLLVSLPGWVCPSHHHLSAAGKKDEGFLVVLGTLIVSLPDGTQCSAQAGGTIYMKAGTIHALSSGDEGAVYFEFSETDARIDVFTDIKIVRDPRIDEDVAGYVPPKGGFQILGNIGLRLEPHVQLQAVPIR